MSKYTAEQFSKAYAWAQLSSSDPYPSYLKIAARTAIEKIRSVQEPDTLHIAFITDIHYSMTETNRIRMKRLLNIYREIAAQIPIDRLVLGGDHVCDACKEYKYDAFVELREQFGDLPFFPINGNHDDGTIWDMKLQNPVTEHLLSQEKRHEAFYQQANPQGNHLYYYNDDPEKKVRYIFLDSNDVDYIYDEGKLRYRGQDLFIFSQKQIDWFLQDALHLEEEGWRIICFLHGLPPEDANDKREHYTWENGFLLYEILHAYKAGTDLHTTFGKGDFKRSLDADFSSGIRGEILACIMGDEHNDRQNVDSAGIPYIVERNAFPFYYDPPHVQRRDGDETEVAFAILSIHPTKKIIHVTRIGKGEDAVLSYT